MLGSVLLLRRWLMWFALDNNSLKCDILGFSNKRHIPIKLHLPDFSFIGDQKIGQSKQNMKSFCSGRSDLTGPVCMCGNVFNKSLVLISQRLSGNSFPTVHVQVNLSLFYFSWLGAAMEWFPPHPPRIGTLSNSRKEAGIQGQLVWKKYVFPVDL